MLAIMSVWLSSVRLMSHLSHHMYLHEYEKATDSHRYTAEKPNSEFHLIRVHLRLSVVHSCSLLLNCFTFLRSIGLKYFVNDAEWINECRVLAPTVLSRAVMKETHASALPFTHDPLDGINFEDQHRPGFVSIVTDFPRLVAEKDRQLDAVIAENQVPRAFRAQLKPQHASIELPGYSQVCDKNHCS